MESIDPVVPESTEQTHADFPRLIARRGGLVGASQAMRTVFDLIDRIAPTELAVLISGETGTGKDVAARAIHDLSKRAHAPFVALDCSAIPPTLIESALFGHEKGAYTGADRSYIGALERAQGGTIFLDELGELPVDLQPKLLRAIERREVERLHGDGPIPLDVRVIAATNRPLEAMVTEGTFRGDLYYRLAVFRLTMPALRERVEDIPVIIDHFFDEFREELERYGARARRLGPAALSEVMAHPFPGNVRELLNVLRRAAILAQSEEVRAEDLPPDLAAIAKPTPPQAPSRTPSSTKMDYKQARERLLAAFERKYIQDLLARNRHEVSRAAREAGIGRRHLHRLMHKHGITSRSHLG
jgi:DNA-binding NtrC family response regulator